jgi:hypothetical protein
MAVMVAELTMGFSDFAQFLGRASGRGVMASSTLCSDSREPGAIVWVSRGRGTSSRAKTDDEDSASI